MKLNEKIIKLRKEKGLSQEELGNAINVSRQAVSKWESETTKPDIAKLKELAKFFNVSYEYLLNDELEENININKTQEKIEPTQEKTPIKKVILKILLFILLLYFIYCLYKFIVLFRFYTVANSFSEVNYYMANTDSIDNKECLFYETYKYDNTVLRLTSNPFETEKPITDENGKIVPYLIEYINYDTKEWYHLSYDESKHIYTYSDFTKLNANTKYLEEILNGEKNYLKESTLSVIPHDFKTFLLSSINPCYMVSPFRNEIYINVFGRYKQRIILNKDCLIQDISLDTEFDGTVQITTSYNYVQAHQKPITSPLETYKDKIVRWEDIIE